MPHPRFKKGDVVEVNAEWCSINNYYTFNDKVGPFGLVLDDVSMTGVFVPVFVCGEVRHYTRDEIVLVDIASETYEQGRRVK